MQMFDHCTKHEKFAVEDDIRDEYERRLVAKSKKVTPLHCTLEQLFQHLATRQSQINNSNEMTWLQPQSVCLFVCATEVARRP